MTEKSNEKSQKHWNLIFKSFQTKIYNRNIKKKFLDIKKYKSNDDDLKIWFEQKMK